MKEFVHNFPGRKFFPFDVCFSVVTRWHHSPAPSFMQKKIFLLFGYVNAFSSAFFYNFYYPRQKLLQVYYFFLDATEVEAS